MKFTTAYSVADRVVRLVMGKLGYDGNGLLRPKTGMSFEDDSSIVQSRQLDTDIVDHLQVQYGMDMAKVLTSLLHEDCRNGNRIGPRHPIIKAEVLHAVREEMALHLVRGDLKTNRARKRWPSWSGHSRRSREHHGERT